MGLRTAVCDALGIEVPVVLAGMGGAANPKLAAAVSNAGGLGVLGAATLGPDELRAWIREIRSLTDRPFGVDTLLPASVGRMKPTSGPSPMDELPAHQAFMREFLEQEGLEEPSKERRQTGGLSGFSQDFFESQMKVVIDERVPVYAAGLGSPGPWVEQLHKNGTIVMAVVGAVRHTRRAVDSGVDLIVAQGHDAGGHNSPIGTMALIPQVVDAVGDVPVLAAGGISDGRGVAAAMMLGAQGVWIGTAFLASEEANILPFQQKALIESSEENTVVSRSFTGKPARMIRNKWAQAYAESDLDPLPMPFQGFVSTPVMQASARAQREDISVSAAGQGVGMIKEVRPAADILTDMVAEAERTLRSATRIVT